MLKYKFMILMFLLLSLILINKTYAIFNNRLPFIGKIFYIDPGHGGVDPGAVYKDLKESDINLIFAKKMGEDIEELGGTVFYTRDDNYDLSSTSINRKRSDLSNRIKIINDSKADIYLSIHVNSENSNSWYGSQIFYTMQNTQSIEIATSIQKKLKESDISKRKISIIKNTYMYDKILIPGVLIETGFLSNYSDRKKLQDDDYISKFSENIVIGIMEYFE